MVENILIVADLGAAGNLIKNLCLLSNDSDWPLPESRYNRILKQYSSNTSFDNWLSIEYTLRFWQLYYTIDLSDHLDYTKYVSSCKKTDLPIVFLNHSAFHQIDEFLKFQKKLHVIYICPTTDQGFEWQVRNYCEKKSVNKLHNFTFCGDIENQKNNCIKKYGIEFYHQLNIDNMRHILKQRQIDFCKYLDPIPLESFLTNVEDACKQLQSKINLIINYDEFCNVLTSWQKLHWNYDDTYKWKYSSNP
jgi:hypothetical protein